MIRILLALVLMTSSASAQFGGAATPKPIVPVNTFSVDGADAETLTKILGDQFPGIAFSADQASSTIFARVDGEEAEHVQALIEEIRIRAAEANDRRMKRNEQRIQEQEAIQKIALGARAKTQGEKQTQLRSFQLQHVSAEEAGRVLSLLEFDEKAAIAVAGSNLLVRADADNLEEISEVLQQMDTPQRMPTQPELAYETAVELMPDINPMIAGRRLRQFTNSHPKAEQPELKLLQLQALELANEVRVNENAGRNEELMQALHENVSHQFHRKLEQDRREMEQIRRRLDQISQRLEMQERLADRIIEQRIQELMEGRDKQVSDRDRERPDDSGRFQAGSEDTIRQKVEHLEALEGVLDELARQERDHQLEQDDQAIRMRENLKAEYRALSEQLMPRENLQLQNQSERRLLEDRARYIKELNEDRKQWQQLPMLNKLETELERLQAIEQQQGSQLQGELAERQAQLEEAYRDLKRRLRPDDFEEDKIEDDSELEAEDDVEEVSSDSDPIEEDISVSIPDKKRQP